MRICSKEGCIREHHARGLCRSHYVTKWRHDHPEAKASRKPVQQDKQNEYNRRWRESRRLALIIDGVPPSKRGRPPKICSKDGCTNHVLAKNLCKTHYERQRIAKTGTALERRREYMREYMKEYARTHPKPNRRRYNAPRKDGLTCCEPACNNPVHYVKHMLCGSHYWHMRKLARAYIGLPSMEYGQRSYGPCSEPGCDRHAVTKKYMLCLSHYRSNQRRAKIYVQGFKHTNIGRSQATARDVVV